MLQHWLHLKFKLNWAKFPNDLQAIAPKNFQSKRERLLERGGKEGKERSLRRLVDESCWWVTGLFGFLATKTPGPPRILVSCDENLETGCTLTNQKLCKTKKNQNSILSRLSFWGYLQNWQSQKESKFLCSFVKTWTLPKLRIATDPFSRKDYAKTL